MSESATTPVAPAQPATPAAPATPESNTQQTPATPQAAPDIAQREAAREQTWESLKAELLDGQAPPTADANTQQTQTPADPWEAHKPKGPPIQSLRDRLLAKEGRQIEQTKAQQLEQQLLQQQQALQESQWRQQQADRAYEEARLRGDADGMLRARGIQSFEEVQRAKLIQMGAMQGAQDPRVDQLQQELAQIRQREVQQQQAWHQQQEQQRQQREYQENLALAKTELLSLGLPDIAEFVELPGAVQSVFQLMAQNHSLTTAQAAALVRDDYLNQLGSPVAKWLAKVNGAPQPQPQQVQSSGLPAAAPLGQRPANLSREEAWEWDKRELGWA